MAGRRSPARTSRPTSSPTRLAPPTITSAAAADFTVGQGGTFTVTTTPGVDPAGDGKVSLSAPANELPNGVTFADHGNGTAVIAGTPASGTSGVYDVTITASNGVSPDATQSFTLTVLDVPTSPLDVSATPGVGAATVTWMPPASDGQSTIASYTVTASAWWGQRERRRLRHPSDGERAHTRSPVQLHRDRHQHHRDQPRLGPFEHRHHRPRPELGRGERAVLGDRRDRLLGHFDGGEHPRPEPHLLVRVGRSELALHQRQHRRRERDLGARGAGLHLRGRRLERRRGRRRAPWWR